MPASWPLLRQFLRTGRHLRLRRHLTTITVIITASRCPLRLRRHLCRHLLRRHSSKERLARYPRSGAEAGVYSEYDSSLPKGVAVSSLFLKKKLLTAGTHSMAIGELLLTCAAAKFVASEESQREPCEELQDESAAAVQDDVAEHPGAVGFKGLVELVQ